MASTLAHNLKDRERTSDVKITDKIPFSQMLLSDPVQKGLDKCGFVLPSPIQIRAIPLGKSGLGKDNFELFN